ncbi:GLPGLI family protein [Segetibacter koreensis]|uniref:GLPGLI family protein n=1 Tax=Segetibacter koreensis TaxID=398037 RepID=UPI0003779131|nr:GLPGLI family protein [Segetibacter koreensis]
MKQLIITLLFTVMLLKVTAQTPFIVKGKIEFEKKVNLYKQLDNEEDESWRNMMKKMLPASKTSYFDLYFNGNKTVYTPGREVVSAQKVPEWFDGPATDNIVFTDLEQQNAISQKTVFDDIYNIQDSVRKMSWKITADTRTIAGFECRKATAIIMDSVFVVAFFTDQIVTSGGPESFSGLPGMILGIAVPRLNTTWFATKVELVDVKETTLLAPKKGKKTNISNLKIQLNSAMKNWGKWRDKNIWQIMI